MMLIISVWLLVVTFCLIFILGVNDKYLELIRAIILIECLFFWFALVREVLMLLEIFK